MKTVIYYFSATGNSLMVARDLAEMIDGECELVSAMTVYGKSLAPQADAIGFVFPNYGGDMAYPIRNIIDNMTFVGDPYVFSVITFGGGHYSAAAANTAELISSRGAKLSASFPFRMPGNVKTTPPEEAENRLNSRRENSKVIADKINARFTEEVSMEEVHPSDYQHVENLRAFAANENCAGCGLCAMVCPMNNITVEDGRALVGDNCVSCHACFHWCPSEAIVITSERFSAINGRTRYHHPEVTPANIASLKN